MARVTEAEVKAIMDTSLEDAIFAPYIISAAAMVDENLANAGLSETILKEIERWLTAHLVAVTKEKQSKKEGAGGASIEYTGEWGTGLNSTSFGQMAIALDTSGTLESLSGGKKRMTIIAL